MKSRICSRSTCENFSDPTGSASAASSWQRVAGVVWFASWMSERLIAKPVDQCRSSPQNAWKHAHRFHSGHRLDRRYYLPMQTTKLDLGYLWVKRIVAILGVIVTAGAAFATGSMLIHGHPAYIVLLAVTLVVSVTVAALGIAFLSSGACATARAAHHPVTRWVVGGHSLGGVVAATDAETFAGATRDPVVGLFFFASYPATNIAQVHVAVLSVSGSNDGLSTPAKIAAAKPKLPAATRYLVVEGGVHAFFGDYGPQDGDGEPAISHDQARAEIAAGSVAFVTGLGG